MQMSANTILVTGGGSGIGRGLAEAFHRLGNTVIIAGRRKHLLDETTAANPGMASASLDIGDAISIAAFAREIEAQYPALNVVIHNAGMMTFESLRGGVEVAEATITTNLLGPIRLTAALLPLLEKQPRATIVTVTSGLAFVPLAAAPTYCATKAALHSYTQSLRYQLKDTAVEVIELPPPYVQTDLTGSHQANDPRAMPLKDFIAETISLLQTTPGAHEICVDRVKPMRSAEANGDYEAFFATLNNAMAAPQT